MTLVVYLLAFNCLLGAGFLHYLWKRKRDPQSAPAPKRLSGEQVWNFASRQLMLVVVLAYAYAHGEWTPASVGVHDPGNWLESILAGELAYIALILVYVLLMRATRLFIPLRLAASRANLTVWPRRRMQKIFAAIFIMGFNPFTEELVMRGVLIHHWGLLLGSPVLPIAIGFVLNGVLHLYQGWRMQLWHAMFFAMAVSLLYSPWGLLAAITAHVFGDTLPLLHLRRNLLKAREAHRASLRRPTT